MNGGMQYPCVMLVAFLSDSRPTADGAGVLPPFKPAVPGPGSAKAAPSFFMPSAASSINPAENGTSAVAPAAVEAPPTGRWSEGRPDSLPPAHKEAIQQAPGHQPSDALYGQPAGGGGATSSASHAPSAPSFGRGWAARAPADPGMGRRKGSFSQYMSPPVSTSTSQGASSPPHPVQLGAAGSALQYSQPAAAPEASSLADATAATAQTYSPQDSGRDNMAGSDFYTSYAAVLGDACDGQVSGAAMVTGCQAHSHSAEVASQDDWGAKGAAGVQAGWYAQGVFTGTAPGAGDEMTEVEL
jgi:hypothetical protein